MLDLPSSSRKRPHMPFSLFHIKHDGFHLCHRFGYCNESTQPQILNTKEWGNTDHVGSCYWCAVPSLSFTLKCFFWKSFVEDWRLKTKLWLVTDLNSLFKGSLIFINREEQDQMALPSYFIDPVSHEVKQGRPDEICFTFDFCQGWRSFLFLSIFNRFSQNL